MTALRELALRIVAEKVDHELTEVRTIPGTAPSGAAGNV